MVQLILSIEKSAQYREAALHFFYWLTFGLATITQSGIRLNLGSNFDSAK